MHFCVTTYLIMGLVAQCTVNALIYPVGYKKEDILWSYRLLPNAHFPAHSALTPTEIKAAAKHLVDTILKEHSHGSPRMRSDSPEFIGDPDSVNITITSRVEVGGLTCPCDANLKVDREKGLIFTEIYNDLTGVQ
ncbi:hypothetical protein C8R41DRAFT_924578 [Lentinula lateritia]|uniref:Uncharacterized protein n=1 Tax=Lentinula lateritia TaxID=40482 RepID=A0ABQ8V3T5_9AGAR|nr:hypothetical protein C8R41DRAFT_924578 [Lentinula lateritia]